MTRTGHPLLDRVLRKTGATADAVPTPEAWQAMLALVARTYEDADQDRYMLERAVEISSREMRGLHDELARKADEELALLRQSEERHRLLVDHNPIPVWVFEAATLRFLAVNDAMVQLYGYSREELLSMTFNDIKMQEDMGELVGKVSRASIGDVRHIGVRRHRRKDGAVLDMDITSNHVVFEGRHAVIGIGVDQTQERALEVQLRQSQKMEAIGQLAGGVAHDFNNILAVIIANADMALEELDPAHYVRTDIAEIAKAATRAAGLTRQLLAFSRKQHWQPKPLALNSIVTNLESMLSRLVGEDIVMSAVLSPALGTIEADAGELEQLITNLVVNARDAMPAGGKLTLETANTVLDEAQARLLDVRPGRYVALSVTDTGCGMTDDVKTRMFEPFFTTKPVDKGTGLGLSMVFGIVKRSAGAISVTSALGRGTTFKILLPRVAATEMVGMEPLRFTPPTGSGTVLVVEDDDQVRQVVRRYLTRWGYTLIEARSGAAALEVARTHGGKIDLLLTDLVMPGMDGHSLSRALLESRPSTKVLFMSGYTDHPALAKAAFGASDSLVQKPFTATSLGAAITRALAA